MNINCLRRLTKEHQSLQSSPLPPNYLFPPATDSTLPDDLTQLVVLLAGPQGTPYSQGVWRLQLKMPADYPASPPKATFKTRIWHPNVDEATGAVCVDTLKRDWKKELSLRDILVTISCLLIYPNPDSALNSSAGHLIQEDFEAFARQARLMTSIHAPVSSLLQSAVTEAKQRGNGSAVIPEENASQLNQRRKMMEPARSTSSVIMKNEMRDLASAALPEARETTRTDSTSVPKPGRLQTEFDQPSSDDEEFDEADEYKENDPSLSPSPVNQAPPTSHRSSNAGKRPLSDLPCPADVEDDQEDVSGSERNAANKAYRPSPLRDDSDMSQPRKSPKLSERTAGVNASGRVRDDSASFTIADDGKENFSEPDPEKSSSVTLSKKASPAVIGEAARTNGARVLSTGSASSISSASARSKKPRVGLRRL
ncbi:MAG: hypothetical protein M1825_003809 [Sarcosagium campestre]|nr:MAG: hypothetical protein M1825_003809 [Sarcosagium campestre]